MKNKSETMRNKKKFSCPILFLRCDLRFYFVFFSVFQKRKSECTWKNLGKFQFFSEGKRRKRREKRLIIGNPMCVPLELWFKTNANQRTILDFWSLIDDLERKMGWGREKRKDFLRVPLIYWLIIAEHICSFRLLLIFVFHIWRIKSFGREIVMKLIYLLTS